MWPGNPTQPGVGHNAGDDFWNAGIMFKQEQFTVSVGDPRYADRVAIATLEDIIVKENWIGGGVASLNIATDPYYGNTYTTCQFTGNRFLTRQTDWGKTMRGYASGDGGIVNYNTGQGYYILRPQATFTGTLSGNVNEQTGIAVPITNGA